MLLLLLLLLLLLSLNNADYQSKYSDDNIQRNNDIHDNDINDTDINYANSTDTDAINNINYPERNYIIGDHNDKNDIKKKHIENDNDDISYTVAEPFLLKNRLCDWGLPMHLSVFHFAINMNNVSTNVMIKTHPIFGWIWVVPLSISATVSMVHQKLRWAILNNSPKCILSM